MSFVGNSLKNVLIYGCGLMIVNATSFLMLFFYTRQFPPAEYAIITLLLTCLPFTRYCLPLEICQAAPVFSSDDQAKSYQYISIGWWFALAMNIFCYAIVYLANSIFDFLPYASWWLFSLFFLLAIDCLFYYSSNILRWQLRPFSYNFIIGGVALLEVALTILFVLAFKFSLFGVFYSWMISRLLGLLLVYGCTHKSYAFFFNMAILKKMLSFSIPLVLSNLVYNLNRAFDRWIIAALIGLATVGIYGTGATIGGAVSFIMASLSTALSPFIYKNHQNADAPLNIAKLFYIVIAICMIACMFFALFNKDILMLLVSEVYYEKLIEQPIVPIIVLSAVIAGLTIFSPGIIIKKKTSYLIWFNIISLAINVGFSLLFVSHFGMTGIAFSMLISVSANTFLYMFLSQKLYPLPFHFPHLFFLTSLFLLFYLGGIWLGIKYEPLTLYSISSRLCYYLLFSIIIISVIWKIYKELSSYTIKDKLSYDYIY